jgi:transposase-like protein
MGRKLGGCPSGPGEQVVKCGTTDPGNPRYRCHTPEGGPPSFLLAPASTGRLPEIKPQGLELRLNGSGSRDTGRGLPIRPATGIQELKRRARSSRRGILPS